MPNMTIPDFARRVSEILLTDSQSPEQIQNRLAKNLKKTGNTYTSRDMLVALTRQTFSARILCWFKMSKQSRVRRSVAENKYLVQGSLERAACLIDQKNRQTTPDFRRDREILGNPAALLPKLVRIADQIRFIVNNEKVFWNAIFDNNLYPIMRAYDRRVGKGTYAEITRHIAKLVAASDEYAKLCNRLNKSVELLQREGHPDRATLFKNQFDIDTKALKCRINDHFQAAQNVTMNGFFNRRLDRIKNLRALKGFETACTRFEQAGLDSMSPSYREFESRFLKIMNKAGNCKPLVRSKQTKNNKEYQKTTKKTQKIHKNAKNVRKNYEKNANLSGLDKKQQKTTKK